MEGRAFAENCMSLSPEIEARGLKAYEQVRAFERLRTWRLPVSYAFFILLPVVIGIAAWVEGHMTLASANMGGAIFLSVASWLHWQRLKVWYRANVELLAELERIHGDQLPWIQVEKHFAALEKLKSELAEEERAEEGRL
jgi:hypothetical protein